MTPARRLSAALLAIGLLAPATPAAAQLALADLAAVDAAVAAFTGAALGTPGGAMAAVDRRLRLARCAQPLALSWYGVARDRVQVDCPVPGGWRLFLPVHTGSAERGQPPAIARGDAISVAVSGPGFAVAQPAEALDSGAVGGWIRVKTLGAAPQTLRARVVRPGLVGIDLP